MRKKTIGHVSQRLATRRFLDGKVSILREKWSKTIPFAVSSHDPF